MSINQAPGNGKDEPMEMVDVVIGTKTYTWPRPIVEDEDAFVSLFNNDVWKGLSEAHREHLKKLLPSHEGLTEERVLEKLFDRNETFFFGHPVTSFHRHAVNGSYNFLEPSDAVRLRDNARVLYDHQIRRYYLKLLRTLIANRRNVLEQATSRHDPLVDDNALEKSSSLPSSTALLGRVQPYDGYKIMQKRMRQYNIQQRALKRTRIMLSDVKNNAGEPDVLSSDDEELAEISSKITTVSDGVTTLSDTETWRDLQMHQPVQYADVHDMLLEYRALKSTDPEHPALNTGHTTLEEVAERCNMTPHAYRAGLLKHDETGATS